MVRSMAFTFVVISSHCFLFAKFVTLEFCLENIIAYLFITSSVRISISAVVKLGFLFERNMFTLRTQHEIVARFSPVVVKSINQ